MKTYLLDTNVLSEPIKTMPDRQVMAMLQRHQHAMVTAAPIWHELRYGCLRLPVSQKRQLLEAYLEDVVWLNLDILPYDERAAEWHAEERARLTALGQTPPFVDGQIAAIAAVNGLILVTRNAAAFSTFKDLEVEVWHRVGSGEAGAISFSSPSMFWFARVFPARVHGAEFFQ